jgi:hypothetical protein
LKNVIFCSGSRFPVSVVAGAIIMKLLPPVFDKALFWNAGCRDLFYSDVLDSAYCLGETRDGTRVMVFSAPSAGRLLANLTGSFLEINGIAGDLYRVVEIDIPDRPVMKLGHLLLRLPLTRRAGKRMLEGCLAQLYPQLVMSLQLDGNFQISDN